MTSNFQRKRIKMQAEFKSLMEFASDLAKENPKALADLVRMYLRPLQADMIIDAATKGQNKDVPVIDQRGFFLGIDKIKYLINSAALSDTLKLLKFG